LRDEKLHPLSKEGFMSYLNEEAETFFFKRQKEIIRRLGVSDPPSIVDVGGNIGQSIDAYRALFPDSRIFTIEPLPECFNTLVKRFGGHDRIHLEHIALADSAGIRPFYSTRCRTASSLLQPDDTVRKKSAQGNYEYDVIQTKVDTLDNYCGQHGIELIDVLKIDVQGAEISVLKGAENLLKRNSVRMIYLEVIFADNYKEQSGFVPIAEYLGRFEYVLWDVRPFLFTRSGRLWTANAIFTSRPSTDLLEHFPDDFPWETGQ
jgi:FkbM family methyltransferase